MKFLQKFLRNACQYLGLVCICKVLLATILFMTICINVNFIVRTNRNVHSSSDTTASPGVISNARDDKLSKALEKPQWLRLEVLSSKSKIQLSVNGTTIFSVRCIPQIIDDTGKDVNRGIHVMILNQATGSLMAHQVFDTYLPNEDVALVSFLDQITRGRIVVFIVKDEGSFQLLQETRDYLTKNYGSDHIGVLGWRDMWAMVAQKEGKKFNEGYSKSTDLSIWAKPLLIKADILLQITSDQSCSFWAESADSSRRQRFCSKMEGFGDVCLCDSSKPPSPISFSPPPLPPHLAALVSGLPIAVIASNRPYYLHRMLSGLLAAQGVNASLVTVFIDGYFESPMEVCRLFNIRCIHRTPSGELNARISQHYKASLSATFSLYQRARHCIVLEEDLDVSPDILSYFSQTVQLLDTDESLYCISAWNDQGYDHSSKDPQLLYRVETMPGLGWMLKRSLFKKELEPVWPSQYKQWDWDIWMRSDGIRKGRECIIPDVSRTYHFGSKGLNMNPFFHETYFKNHSINKQPNVVLKDVMRMTKYGYERLLDDLVRKAEPLRVSQSSSSALISSCSLVDNLKSQISSNSSSTYLLYISMWNQSDFTTWKQLAKCLNIWDLDIRGVHQCSWRIFIKESHVVVVGHPASPYSHYKPADIIPLSLSAPIVTGDT